MVLMGSEGKDEDIWGVVLIKGIPLRVKVMRVP